MDKKSTFFFIFLLTVILVSIEFTFYRYVVLKDYTIFTDENIVPTLFELFKIK